MSYLIFWNILYWEGIMLGNYIVNDGDTIDSIAKKFNTTKNVIEGINGNSLNIKPGVNVFVPKITNDYFDYYTITKGDTLYKIANDNLLNPALLAQLNGINVDDYIYPNQVLLIPKAGSIIYFTAEGDTLDEIAKGIKTTPNELIKQNNKIYLQPEQLIIYKYQ